MTSVYTTASLAIGLAVSVTAPASFDKGAVVTEGANGRLRILSMIP